MCLQLFKEVPARAWFATFSVGAVALVAIGLQIQAIDRLAPCPLCIFQRVLYLVIGLVALWGWILPQLTRLWAGLMVVVGGGGFLVAAYQTWMQAFPHLARECNYTDPDLIERFVDWLGSVNPGLFLATGFCASRDWTFLGLSMANWSVLVFGGFAVAGFLMIRCRVR